MLKIKTAVLVSGGGTNLQAIIDAAAAGKLSACELALTVSSKEGAYALTRAAAASIKTATVPKKGMEQDVFEKEIIRLLEENGIELIVLAGFMCILSENFTKRYPERIINVHPSLIPAFCGKGYYGLRVHEAALEYGVKITGATVHFVNEVPDGGRILLQKAVEIKANDTPETLQRRVMERAEWKILPRAVQAVAKKLIKEKQNGNL